MIRTASGAEYPDESLNTIVASGIDICISAKIDELDCQASVSFLKSKKDGTLALVQFNHNVRSFIGDVYTSLLNAGVAHIYRNVC